VGKIVSREAGWFLHHHVHVAMRRLHFLIFRLWVVYEVHVRVFYFPYAPDSTTQITQWHTTYSKYDTPGLLLLQDREAFGVFIVKIWPFGNLTVGFGRKYFVWPFVSIFGNLAKIYIWPHIPKVRQSKCFHVHSHKYASVPDSCKYLD